MTLLYNLLLELDKYNSNSIKGLDKVMSKYKRDRFDDEVQDDPHGTFTPEMMKIPQEIWI